MKRVIGIGNALTDFLVNLRDDQVLTKLNLGKGSMILVDSELQRQIQGETADLPHTLSLGGSAGNTIRCMARLGTKVGYIGKVGKDSTGHFYEQALDNLGITPYVAHGVNRSGRCVSLISPDGERTMVTYLGAALELCEADITAEMFEGYDCLYIEGFMVQSHSVIRHAIKLVKQCGLKVAIDLASYNVVLENRAFLLDIVDKYVDIIFANEQEAAAFSGEQEAEKALEFIAARCELAIVKVGTRGALIKQAGQEAMHVGIMAAAKRVDTTGAGDFYAAGFMSGLCQGLDLRQCGTIGAITAGKVIEVVGTTFGEEAWKEIFSLVEDVKAQKYLF
ncbi:MAG: adenosine kinase [Tidjanibacter sp.]|nr:adenosine kinase [Tidjanibacter sp.]